ncbi:gibberellin-regulated protein 14 [Cucurbita maxima]|uniref:Gibberellin-regulated protein 14 n=1 Tax=Cucurbita maxima TaxID=3661 RepID=A0A6J1J8R5_CUCMA|nr:gibberellin-regulated protein 14 [Cucurbita maxima]
MSSMANLFVFSVFVLLASWASANANGLSQEKDAVYPKVPVPIPAPSPPVYKAPSPLPPVKPPTIPVLTPPPVKAPYTPVPPVKLPPPPYTPSPPVKPPVKAPYTPSPPAKAPSSPPPAKAPVNPPVKPPSPAAPRPPPVIGKACNPECGRRCQLHSRKNVCIRACLTCCYRCRCVPPGTYGNREVCGKCYTDMTTHGNRPKCP